MGSVSTPVVRSLHRFLSSKSLEAFPVEFSITEGADVDEEWQFHKYLSYTSNVTAENGPTKLYDHIYAYGTPHDVEEYSWRAQLVQFSQYRSLFEGYSLYQWRYYSAVVFWKSQSPWPTLRGALYDYYLDSTGGFWGVRAATSYPLHIQLNPHAMEVSLINRSPCEQQDVIGYLTVFDMDGNIYSKDILKFGPIAGNSVFTSKEIIKWPHSSKGENIIELLFIRLELDNIVYGNEYSNCAYYNNLRTKKNNNYKNVYWLPHPSKRYHPRNFEILSYYRNKKNVKLQIRWEINKGKDKDYDIKDINYYQYYDNQNPYNHKKWLIHIFNPMENKEVAFMIRFTLLRCKTSNKYYDDNNNNKNERNDYDPRVLPTWFSDNYVTLLPGESMIVYMETRNLSHTSKGSRYSLEVEGWNVRKEEYKEMA